MRAFTAICLASAVFAIAPSAGAQGTAGALGKPIADDSLGVGTVVVRVVNGSLSKPVSSLEVGLVDESGKELVVRTGPQGRAEFHNLPPGGIVTAFAKVGDVEMSSEPLVVATKGGLRVVLSPTPISSAPGSGTPETGPHAGADPGGGGMPDPRQMSGIARPEKDDPPGQLTVRTIQGVFRNDPIAGRVADPAAGTTVYLVGFGKGGVVTIKSQVVDEEGRATFGRLAKDNSISYWVLASFARNGTFDRLQSSSIELLPQVGLRVMLAGLARDSREPGVDDLAIFRQRKNVVLPAPGTVVVELAGQAESAAGIELVDATSGKVVGKTAPQLEEPITQVDGSLAAPVPDPALRDGLIQLRIAGPSGPLPEAVVRVFAAPAGGASGAAADAVGEPIVELRADANGLVNIEALELIPSGAGTSIILAVSARGKEVRSSAVVIPAKGGTRIIATWRWQQLPQSLRASFNGVAVGTDKIYFARAQTRGQTRGEKAYFSPPFQMLPDRGAVVGVLIYPELLLGFQGGAELDDNRIWFQMRFSIANPSLAPLDTGKEGLLIPLPPGFVGASVADEMSSRVTVDKEHGFIWKGAFPPGQRDFTAQFALPVNDGDVDFAMPLPHGTFNSHLIFEDIAGMELTGVPKNAQRETREGEGGRRFIMLRQINVRAGQTLQFSIRGLPVAPGWKRLGRILAGLGVLTLLILGFGSILATRARLGAPSQDEKRSRKEQLLSRVVALDEKRAKASGTKPDRAAERQRAALIAELEEIYGELDE